MKTPKNSYKERFLTDLPSHPTEEAQQRTYFDEMVASAACVLAQRGAKKIYARHIMELLSGNEQLTLRPERKREVEDSLRRAGPWLSKKYSGFACERARIPRTVSKSEMTRLLAAAPPELLRVPHLPTSQENLSLTLYLYLRTVRQRPVRFRDLCRTLDLVFPEETYYKNRKKETIRRKIDGIYAHFQEHGLSTHKLL